jgi:hypothetical protein
MQPNTSNSLIETRHQNIATKRTRPRHSGSTETLPQHSDTSSTSVPQPQHSDLRYIQPVHSGISSSDVHGSMSGSGNVTSEADNKRVRRSAPPVIQVKGRPTVSL